MEDSPAKVGSLSMYAPDIPEDEKSVVLLVSVQGVELVIVKKAEPINSNSSINVKISPKPKEEDDRRFLLVIEPYQAKDKAESVMTKLVHQLDCLQEKLQKEVESIKNYIQAKHKEVRQEMGQMKQDIKQILREIQIFNSHDTAEKVAAQKI